MKGQRQAAVIHAYRCNTPYYVITYSLVFPSDRFRDLPLIFGGGGGQRFSRVVEKAAHAFLDVRPVEHEAGEGKEGRGSGRYIPYYTILNLFYTHNLV